MKGILLMFACLVIYAVSGYSQAELLKKEIDKIIRYEKSVDFKVVPGVLVGIIDGDSTYRYSFGRPLNMDGIYEIGSITKPIVAWLANEALVSLKLDRFASVCSFLPDSLCGQPWISLNVDQVIEHKTGLPRLAPDIGEIESDVTDPYRHYSVEMLAGDLKQINPAAGAYSYSHMGYAMLYWLFEKSGGLAKFTDKNLELIGMKNTKWHYPDTSIEQGHGLDGRRQPPWNTNALMPAIGLKSSLDDLIAFIRILFDGYESNQRRYEPAALKKQLRSLSKTGAYKVVDGWFVIRADKSLVYYHNGRTGGHHVSIAYTPHLRKGVVVIANGAMGSNDLSLLILRMVNQAKTPKRFN